MKTFITKTSLMAVAAAAALSVGVPAIASAQEFTRPADDAGAYAAPAAVMRGQSGYLALYNRRWSPVAGHNTVTQIEDGYASGRGSGPFGGDPNGN